MPKKPILYNKSEREDLSWLLEEPSVALVSSSKGVGVQQFQQLSAVLGFNLSEWAGVLHISERTLQRYLKAGKAFTGLQAELLLHLKRLTEAGLQLFSTPEDFIKWLRRPKEVLGQELSYSALQSISGIRLLHQELGRIAHGVYI